MATTKNAKVDEDRKSAAADTAETPTGSDLGTDGAAERTALAEKSLRNYMMTALGVGLVPVPLVDLAAFTGTGVLLVKRLCEIYDVPFKGNIARGALTSLAGAIGAAGLATTFALSVSKLIPGIGTAVGVVSLPLANAAFTYAVGKVFIAHFEMGGTLLDFDAKAYKKDISEFYESGKAKAAAMRRKSSAHEDGAEGKRTGEEPAPAAAAG